MAQAGLTGLDTFLSRQWREQQRLWREDQRAWRSEDMAFRAEERATRMEQQLLFQEICRWREEDLKQRRVNNSRYLWNRFAEMNRRDVEEKSEHMRSLSWLTGLITSFTMTSPIEFSYAPQSISEVRLIPYAICAAIVPTLMTTSTVLCIYLLGSILKMGKWFVAEHAEENFMLCCRAFMENGSVNEGPPSPQWTFQKFWMSRCNNYWNLAFVLFFWGVSFFLALLCTMGFIKFTFDDSLAIAFAVIIGFVFLAWLSTQVKWGAYLRKSRPDGNSSMNSTCRTVEFGSPYMWHLKPK